MIIAGLFLFLLGTKLGEASSKTEVKYEGFNKITVKEEREDKNIMVPGLGSPPFAPSFIHQGSNFFFNPQIVMPESIIPTVVEEIYPLRNKSIPLYETKSEIEEVELIISEPPEIVLPQVEITENVQLVDIKLPCPIPELIIPEPPEIIIPEVEITETVQLDDIELPYPKLELIIPEPPELVIPQVEITETVQLVDIDLPRPNPVLIVEEPSVDCVEINNVPTVLIEEPRLNPGGIFVSEVDVRINEIPPPPELPPLIISEIPRPVLAQERKVILIPSAPELTTFYPPSIIARTSLIPTDCAQNIVMERFLPNVAFEHGKMVELISIPATKRAPVVSSIIY